MKLICGLGNPGEEHQQDRHNVGFMVVDELLRRIEGELSQQKFDARIGHGQLGAQKVLFLEPQTYMNLSGQSLAAAARFYKLAPVDVLVVHDELDLPFGRLQLKAGGGAGGHNGLRSIIECWGTDAFARLRVGIGKPEGAPRDRVVGHVLSSFAKAELPALEAMLKQAADAATTWCRDGLQVAMNRHNRRPPRGAPTP